MFPLTYDHEPWITTDRIRSSIQVAEMNFLHRVPGEELGGEFLLLHIKRGQLGGSDISFRCLLDAFLGRNSGKIQDALEE